VGRGVSFGVLGTDVWKALQNHAAILDRIKYTQKGVVTQDLVAEFLGVPKLFIAYSSQATGPKIPDAKAQDAAATYSFILNSKSMLFGYAGPSVPAGTQRGLHVQLARLRRRQRRRSLDVQLLRPEDQVGPDRG
jgi:hypothetical protein